MRTLTIMLVLVVLGAFPARADDMQKYLSDTQALVRQGSYEEALQRFIWFHEHALEHNPGMYGVRLSFALGYWKDLGEVYPPALEALKRIRDEDTATLSSGRDDYHLFHDVMALNRTLGENSKTVELFQQLDESGDGRAAAYWRIAKDDVIAARRYDLVRKYGGNLLKEFDGVKALYDENVSLYPQFEDADPYFKSFNEDNFVEESLQLIEVALALGEAEAAEAIREKALAVLDDERLREEISPEHQPDPEGDGE